MFLVSCLLHPLANLEGKILFTWSDPPKPFLVIQLGSSGLLLADLGIGDWFGGLLFSAGQQANEAVLDQLSALSFTRSAFFLCS